MAPPHLQPRAKPAIRRRPRTAARPIDPYPFNDQLPPLPRFYEKTFKSGAKVTLKNLPASDAARKVGKATFWDEYEKPKQQALTNYANNPAHFAWHLEHGFVVTVTADRMVITVRQASHKLLLRYLITPQKCLKDDTRMWLGQPSGPKVDMPHAWWAGQCIHFGLPVDSDVNDMKATLLEAIEDRTLAVPPLLQGLRLLRKSEARDTRPSAPMEIEQIDEVANLKFETSDSEPDNEGDVAAASEEDDELDGDGSYHGEEVIDADTDMDDEAEASASDTNGTDILEIYEPNETYRMLKANADVERANRASENTKKPPCRTDLKTSLNTSNQMHNAAEPQATAQASHNRCQTSSRQENVEVVVPKSHKASAHKKQSHDARSRSASGFPAPVTHNGSDQSTQDQHQGAHDAQIRGNTKPLTQPSTSHSAGESSRRASNGATVTAVKSNLQPLTVKSREVPRQTSFEWPIIDSRHPHFGPPIKLPHPRVRPKGFRLDPNKWPNLLIQIDMFKDYYPGAPVSFKDAAYLIDKRNGNVQDAVKDFDKFLCKWKRQRPETKARVNADGSLYDLADDSDDEQAASSMRKPMAVVKASNPQTSTLERTSKATNGSGPVEAERSRDDVIFSPYAEFYKSIRPPAAVLEMAASGVPLPIYAPTSKDGSTANAATAAVAKPVSAKKRKSQEVEEETSDAEPNGGKSNKKVKRLTESGEDKSRPSKVLHGTVMKHRKHSKKSDPTHKQLAERPKKVKTRSSIPLNKDRVRQESASPCDNTMQDAINEADANALPKAFNEQLQLGAGTDQIETATQAEEALSKGFFSPAREARLRNQVSRVTFAASAPDPDTAMDDINSEDEAGKLDPTRKRKSAKGKNKASPSVRKKAHRNMPATSLCENSSDTSSDSSNDDADSASDDVVRHANTSLSSDTRSVQKPKYAIETESEADRAKSQALFSKDSGRKAKLEREVAFLRSRLTDVQICDLRLGETVLEVYVDDHLIGELRKRAMTEAELQDFRHTYHHGNARSKGHARELLRQRVVQRQCMNEGAAKLIEAKAKKTKSEGKGKEVVQKSREGSKQDQWQPVHMSGAVSEDDELDQSPRQKFLDDFKAARR